MIEEEFSEASGALHDDRAKIMAVIAKTATGFIPIPVVINIIGSESGFKIRPHKENIKESAAHKKGPKGPAQMEGDTFIEAAYKHINILPTHAQTIIRRNIERRDITQEKHDRAVAEAKHKGHEPPKRLPDDIKRKIEYHIKKTGSVGQVLKLAYNVEVAIPLSVEHMKTSMMSLRERMEKLTGQNHETMSAAYAKTIYFCGIHDAPPLLAAYESPRKKDPARQYVSPETYDGNLNLFTRKEKDKNGHEMTRDATVEEFIVQMTKLAGDYQVHVPLAHETSHASAKTTQHQKHEPEVIYTSAHKPAEADSKTAAAVKAPESPGFGAWLLKKASFGENSHDVTKPATTTGQSRFPQTKLDKIEKNADGTTAFIFKPIN